MNRWLPWREQLRLGWDIIRWLWWPRGEPTWARITMLIVSATMGISLANHILWGFAAGFILIIAGAWLDVRLRK